MLTIKELRKWDRRTTSVAALCIGVLLIGYALGVSWPGLYHWQVWVWGTLWFVVGVLTYVAAVHEQNRTVERLRKKNSKPPTVINNTMVIDVEPQ